MLCDWVKLYLNNFECRKKNPPTSDTTKQKLHYGATLQWDEAYNQDHHTDNSSKFKFTGTKALKFL
jgi:hypothetical protein